MAYDPGKDKLIEEWSEGTSENDLIIGVYKYGDSEPKIRFTRVVKDWKTQELRRGKAGGLNYDDLQFFKSKLDQIVKAIEVK